MRGKKSALTEKELHFATSIPYTKPLTMWGLILKGQSSLLSPLDRCPNTDRVIFTELRVITKNYKHTEKQAYASSTIRLQFTLQPQQSPPN